MSENTISLPMRGVSRDEVVEFINRVGAAKTCPACVTNAGWSILPIEQVFGLASQDLSSLYPMYILFCENCRFVRLHLRAPVDKAISEHRAKEEPDLNGK